jgi:hypothetical protein
MVLLGTFATWLGRGTLVVVMVVPFPFVLHVVQRTTMRGINVVVVKQHMPWDGLNGGRTRCWRIRERGTS